ncbi:hypothetical protein ACWNYH_00170 [Candidatus Vidania fulgoroideorum]
MNKNKKKKLIKLIKKRRKINLRRKKKIKRLIKELKKTGSKSSYKKIIGITNKLEKKKRKRLRIIKKLNKIRGDSRI